MEPSTVEYFSHQWTDTDLFATWRENTKQNVTVQGRRLENITWRRFFQQKFKLSKLSPKQIDWLKSSDSLWLYGPIYSLEKEAGLDLSICSRKSTRLLKRKSDPTHDIPGLLLAQKSNEKDTKSSKSTAEGGISF